MRAVVAAGDRRTAEAAAHALRLGGNAVDAAVAGAFATFVAEPLLASAGGAGMMTVALPDRAPAVIDFFSSMPGLGGAPAALDFVEVTVDFGSAMQGFHAGRAAVAPPLALPGLVAASTRFGRLPLAELVAPAVSMAREGVAIGRECAHVFRMLWPIQAMSAEAMALASGELPVEGTVLRNPDLADLLEALGRRGEPPPHFEEALLREFGPAAGGLLSAEDLAAAAPRIGAPRSVALGELTALTSPRLGGALVERILERLFASEPRPDEAAEVTRVAEACRAGHEARSAIVGRGSTTHLSALDGDGGAAAVTLTNGEGCGHVARGTGVQLNNFLGEEDLNPHGFHRHAPGALLPTMIAPTIALRDGRPVLALGSGGSNRIRSVVSQVLYRVMRGEPLEAAVRAPRVHAERDDVWVELEARRDPDALLGALGARFARVHPFEGTAFFFGGVNSVTVDRAERTHGVGDPRRGGAVVFV